MRHVDEYHLTGISQDAFVQWERRPPISTEGRGENRTDARGEARPKPEQKKANEAHCLGGLVSQRYRQTAVAAAASGCHSR